MQQNSPNKRPKKSLVKPLKRLSVNGKQSPNNSTVRRGKRGGRRFRLMPETNYNQQLSEFATLRNSTLNPSTSATATMVPSQELIWIRDETEPNLLPPIPELKPKVQHEIEDGEIVEEEEVTEIVNRVIKESFPVLERSRKVVDLNSSHEESIFFEDRSPQKQGEVPKYNTFGETEDVNESKLDSSTDDVICLDSSQPDDSVIFVSEEKFPSPAHIQAAKLFRPQFLNTPVLRNLYNLVPSTSSAQISPTGLTRSKRSPKKKMRVKLWQLKKSIEYAALGKKGLQQIGNEPKPVVETKSARSNSNEPQPSTSGEQTVTSTTTEKEPVKRFVLIDGSNLAMGFTDDYGARKTDKDYSAEGLKIAIDYFADKGFQVKAIVPEYRVRRDKSSNHELMTELKNSGKLVLAPSKSYDDRILLESALKLDAAVVSNDHFRDLLLEKPQYQEVVSRLIRFNWLFQQLIIPEDPHGRNGPKLNDILYKKPS